MTRKMHESTRPVRLSFITTFIFAMVLGDLLWAVKVWIVTRGVRRSGMWRVLGLSFLGLQFACLVTLLLSRSGGPDFTALISRPLLSAFYLWHLILMPFGSIIWLAFALVNGVRRLFRRAPVAETPEPHSGFSRREFLATSFAALPAVITIGATAISQPQLKQFRIRRFTLPFPQLPAALDGLTIAHVTDLHVGRFTEGAILKRIAAATNALSADLVLLTGDLINYDLADLPAGLAMVKSLRAKHGVFMCEGNHDLIENADSFREQTRSAGVALLIDETARIEINGASLELLGLPWTRGDEAIAPSVRKLLSMRSPDAFPILLAHHPHAFDFAEGVPLTLAGHTHGGQLMVNEHVGFGPVIFRYWSGLYKRLERSLIVSNGVGNWFPLRTRAPAEIIHLTLRAGPAA